MANTLPKRDFSLFHLKFVAYTPNRLNVPPGLIWLKLFPESFHMHIHCAGITKEIKPHTFSRSCSLVKTLFGFDARK